MELSVPFYGFVSWKGAHISLEENGKEIPRLNNDDLAMLNKALFSGADEIHIKKTPVGIKLIEIRGKVLKKEEK